MAHKSKSRMGSWKSEIYARLLDRGILKNRPINHSINLTYKSVTTMTCDVRGNRIVPESLLISKGLWCHTSLKRESGFVSGFRPALGGILDRHSLWIADLPVGWRYFDGQTHSMGWVDVEETSKEICWNWLIKEFYSADSENSVKIWEISE
jgi:hypothetical protein